MNLNIIAEEIRQILHEKRIERKLTFTEEDHKYTLVDKHGILRNDFPSVSTVLKKFYKEFPTEEAAYNKANGDPYEQQRLIAEWAASGDYATNMGSRIHYFLEKKTLEMFNLNKDVRQPTFNCDLTQLMKSDNMIKGGVKYLNLMKQRDLTLLDTEMVLGDSELGYTGQPDKIWLCYNKEKTEFGIVISDWKSNKMKNFKEHNYTERMFKPFEKYPNNALGHYYIQLPLYGKLLLKMLQGTKYENLKLYGCIVVLLKDNSEYEEFRVPKDVMTTVLDMNMSDYLLDEKK